METKLKILILEDSPRDVEIVHNLLQNAGFEMEVDVAGEKQAFEKFLSAQAYDIILSDFNLPGYDGKKALELRNRICPDVPFICISGTIGEEIAIDLLKLGANDYVIKDRLERLPSAVKRAIEEAKEKAALKQMHEKLDQASQNWSKTFDAIQDGIFLLDADQKIIEVNQAFLNFIGKPRDEIIGQHCWPFVHNTQCPVDNCPFVKSQTSKKREITELKMGESDYEVMIDPIIDVDNQLKGAVHILKDITERKKAEQVIMLEKELYIDLVKSMPSGVYRVRVFSPEKWKKNAWKSSENAPYIMELISDRYCEILGVSRETITKNPGILNDLVHPEDKDVFAKSNKDANSSLNKFRWEGRIVNDGNIRWVSLESLPRVLENGDVIWTGSIQDITERKKVEESLKESEYFFKETQRAGFIGSYKTDFIKGYWESSEVLDRIFGIDKDYDRSISGWLDIIHPDDREMMSRYLSDEIISKHNAFDKEYRILRVNDGETRWVMGLGKVDFSNEGNLISMMGTIQDITERKLAENLLKERESSLQYAQEIAKMGSWKQNLISQKAEWSENSFVIYGYKPFEFEPTFEHFKNRVHPDDWHKIEEAFDDIYKNKTEHKSEIRIVLPDKNIKWLQINMVPVFKNDILVELIGTHIDITERKQAEEILAKNLRELSILNQFSIKLSMLSSEDNLESTITKAIKEITRADVVVYSDYNPADHTAVVKEIEMDPGLLKKAIGLLGKQVKKMHSEVTNEAYREITSDIIVEYKTLHDASLGTVSRPVSMAIQAMLKIDRFIGVAFMLDGVLYGNAMLALKKDQSDISREIFENIINMAAVSLRRKKAEDALKESESSLHYAQEIAKMGSWEWDVVNNKTFWSPNYYEIFGFDPLKVVPSLELFQSTIYPEDVAFFNEIYSIILKEQKSRTFDLRILQPDDNVKWLQNFIVPFYENGKLIKLKGAFIDITERKQTERMMHDIIEKNPISIQIVDKDGFTLKVNPAHTKLFGAEPPPEFSVFSDNQLMQQGMTETFKRLRKGEVVNFPDSCFNAHDLNLSFPNTDIWVRAIAFPLNESQKKADQFVIMHENITGQKKNEIALKESEVLFATTFNSLPIPVTLSDIDTDKWIEVNDAFLNVTGYTRKEIIGHTFHEFNLWKNLKDRANMRSILMKQGRVSEIKVEINKKNGETGVMLISVETVDLSGKKYLLIMGNEITARLKTEAELKESELRYRTLYKNSPSGILVLDENGIILEANEEIAKTSLYSSEELVGSDVRRLTRPDDSHLVAENIQRILAGEVLEHEFISKRKDGTFYNLIMKEIAIALPNGQRGVLSVSNDITERKKAEEALKKSEEKYRNIFDNVQDVFYQSDLNGIVQEISPSIKYFTDFTREEIIGKPVQNLYYNPEDREILLKELQKKGELKDYELILKPNKGEKMYVSVNARLIMDAQGQPHHIDGALRDISARKYAEDVTRESEERFRKVFEESQIGMIISRKDLLFEKVNPAFCKMMGYTPEELMSMSFIDITHPDEIDSGIENIKILENGTIPFYKVEKRYITKSGKIIWVNVVVTNVRDKDGKLLYYLAMVEDITERRLIEEKLQASKDYLEKIINTVAYPIFVKDEEHKYYLVNTALCEMFGHSKEDIIGKSDNDFISEEQAKEFLIKDDEVYDSGKESKIEEEITDGTGIVKTLITTKTLYTDKDGKKFLVAIINDISERKKMELDLIKAKNKAEESDRLKSAFLANMSHEIRTPMNGILGFADLLKEPKLSGEKQQEFISIIEKSGVRLLNIINDLVNISKIESGLMNVYLTDVNINDQIEYIFKFFKPDIDKKGVHFSSKMGLSSNEAIVKTDREKIIAILTNLVGNAMKFTDKGSIDIGYNKKDNQLEFFVKDTGRGILNEQKEFIFERFRQGSESLNRNYEGAGLGLSISRSYVEMLGGKIWVEIDEGIGSTFYFTIPYNTQPEEIVVISKTFLREEKELQKINLKILIAEDDEISLMLVKLCVNMFAKEILIARTGTEAVNICRNNIDIDLVLMDLKMPEMDGYEAIRQIRQFNNDVIIIAQTAFGLIDDREKAIEAGCNSYISKPINVSELERLIITHFNRK